MAQVDEIIDGIYRVCSLPPGQYPVGFNQFLIDDERPTLIRTGFYESYEAVRGAVAQVLDPKRLAYVVLCHFESDECGGWAASSPTRPRRCSSAAIGARHATSPTGTMQAPSEACGTEMCWSSGGTGCASWRRRTCTIGTR
jgi:hypothetical protein